MKNMPGDCGANTMQNALNPRDYETEEEFNEAVDAAFQRELQKKRGKI